MAPQGATATAVPSTAAMTPANGLTATSPASTSIGSSSSSSSSASSFSSSSSSSNSTTTHFGLSELSCEEIIYEEVDNRFAEPDRHMITDDRVIQNLIRLERLTMPPCNYFAGVQQDIKPNMRKIVTTWMLELLGCCTLLLASKIRQCQPLTVDVLSAYTDHAVSPDQIRNWELLLISKLEWNINAVTAYDYVDHILERAKWGSDDARLREHAHTLIHVCNTGSKNHLPAGFLEGIGSSTIKFGRLGFYPTKKAMNIYRPLKRPPC
uniref:Cyclin N-terminal domain-containing protein n=1 Tax=Anopheles atroparvus TaxID=41427 RepID=A0A182IN77_ANOAO